ncbi:hypothetical protein PQ465_08530 [Sphingobacterium oryzagri]|uniref:Uncharacterized protein n=1 Tax=Sphingobacterium oryzagri TaxID=3025669 RepID=A0ABY7WSX9_9SPHI|nr:hypothetical protein [Sphingobacterium sp. KACC 22765]WDF70409.1 hypothetical protein PQ465_08530 [Sphingobacterium sp. KACC 22765]
MKMKLCIYFLKKIYAVNLALSALFLAISQVSSQMTNIILSFSLFFATVGYSMSFFGYHFFYSKTRYMYFNNGLSLTQLYFYGLLLNMLVLLPLNLLINSR